MTKKDYYDLLWVGKHATTDEIKKAYRKMAMKYHPDKNKGDKAAEGKFKEANEAYETLKDEKKRKQYDTFWSAGSNDFSGFSWGGQGFSGFENAFSGGARGGQFDFWDIFEMFGTGGKTRKSGFSGFQDFDSASGQKSRTTKAEPANLDVVQTVEVPFMDFLLGTKIDVKTVYNEYLKLKIAEGTRPGIKFKIKEKGRKEGNRVGDMYVIAEAKMPKEIPEDVRKLLESIKYRL